MKNEILELLTEIRPEFDFSDSSNYIEEGMLDSFDIVSLVSSIDERYQVSIDGVDIIPENFSNIDSIVSLINRSSKKS
ncbi:MAG: phosphopantetheine-binding protein [Flavobacteriaceae bacterium]|nr:phosphopantetheine-binding protein [Flavobacteriaceae bacterium]